MALHQEHKPAPISYDTNGEPIGIGAYVAFNHAGEVKLGSIVDILSNDWYIARKGVPPCNWWGLKFKVKIKHKFSDRISIIKNPRSFIVIN